jgi:5-methylcytosine-specific restriction protein A
MAGISSLTDRNAVLRAMAEYDQRGREAFLDRYHFGPAKWWYVVNDGKQYDSKAIVGAAIGYQTGRPLTAHDFKGGEGSAVRRLKSLSFEVLRLPVSDATSRIPEEVAESYPEGLRTQVMVNRAERNPAARLGCIEAHGVACACCGMTFAVAYGSEFTGLIHVHHLTPLAGRTELTQVDPKKDLRPVCPNCHAAIHFGGENRSIDTIRTALTKAREAAV